MSGIPQYDDFPQRNNRLLLARKSLEGLAIGDCFGETFFEDPDEAERRINCRQLKPAPWHFTDDTVMGIGVYKALEKDGYIDQNRLSQIFGRNYLLDWHRGYGGTAHEVLRALGNSADWRQVSPKVFDGMGSMGNGAAMRAAPIGAYFYDDIDKAAEQAELSAQVTHFNDEAVAGAIAVVTAAALMVNIKNGAYSFTGSDFIKDVANYVPESDTKYKILAGLQVSRDCNIDFAVSVLGNGLSLLAQDTVSIAVWCAAHFMNSYEEALWKAVSALGDRDTICAIVGSIVALYDDRYPACWKQAAENPFESEFYIQ